MKSWDDFEVAVTEFAEKRVLPRLQARLEASERGEEYRPSPDLLFDKVFSGYTEISNSYEALLDLEIYIRRFPFGRTRVRKSRYLRFVIESYLHEMYILRERLLAYAKVVERMFAKTERREFAANNAKKASLIIERLFRDIIEIRGYHVHERRFSDEQLTQLGGLELIANNFRGDNMQRAVWMWHYESEYRKLRRNWLEKIERWNAAVRTVLDVYSNQLYPVLFDAEGVFRHPAGLRVTRSAAQDVR